MCSRRIRRNFAMSLGTRGSTGVRSLSVEVTRTFNEPSAVSIAQSRKGNGAAVVSDGWPLPDEAVFGEIGIKNSERPWFDVNVSASRLFVCRTRENQYSFVGLNLDGKPVPYL